MTDQGHFPNMDLGPAGLMHEQTFNEALADALRARRKVWREDKNSVLAERYDVLDARMLRPDILVKPPDIYPVVVEVEFGDRPAFGDARKKLGKKVAGISLPVRSAIAVGAPTEIRQWSNQYLRDRLAHPSSLEMHFAILSANVKGTEEADVVLDDKEVHVWPEAGYMVGTVEDLAVLCEYAAAPPVLVSETAEDIAREIHSLADSLFVSLPPGVAKEIAGTLGQHDERQGLRMACCIWLTSLRLHDLLAAKSESLMKSGLRPITQVAYRSVLESTLTLGDILGEWDKILKVNYGSIFSAARASLHLRIPTVAGGDMLNALSRLAAQIAVLRLGNRVDFAGELFPRLLDDREETAAHYTLPETAELLATLAVERIPMDDWSSRDAVAALKVADLACGTGALLRAAYRCIRQEHEAAGGQAADLHRAMMEHSITGLDINVLASHMTAAGLSTTEIETEYETDNIAAVDVKGGRTGSLELLESEQISDITGQLARAATNNHNHEKPVNVGVADHSQDLIIQNPPYSRARGDRKMFDVTGITERQRQRSVDRLKSIRSKLRRDGNEMTNGQAGLGADFSALADRKLKAGGVLATVLPLTAAKAESWEGFRRTIEREYEQILVIAFPSHEGAMMSADTHMNEMLLIATKRQESKSDDEDARVACINLSAAPTSMTEAYWYARRIIEESIDWSVEGSAIVHGFGKQIGSRTVSRVIRPGFPWFAGGMQNHHIAAASAELMGGRLYSPHDLNHREFGLELTTLGKIATIGPTHHLIGHVRGAESIGAFTFDKITPEVYPVYPSLWAADAGAQKSILTLPTHSGDAAVKDDDVLRGMLAYKSDLFISRNLRMTTQALAAARTQEPAMGGSTWTALLSNDEGVRAALAIWLNSTPGLMIRIAYAQITQPGRSRMQVKALAGLPVPDFAADSEAGERARSTARGRYDALAELPMEPVSYSFRDETRHRVDEAALEMLGLAEEQDAGRAVASLRNMWCREPSVHGGTAKIMRALGLRQ